MSMGEKGVCVRILEKEFRVGCGADQEPALREAALYVDKQMRKIRHTGKVVGLERIAIMTALNIAHELLLLKNTPPKIDGDFSERLKVLQDKIDGVLAHHHQSRSEQQKVLARKLKEVQETMEEIV